MNLAVIGAGYVGLVTAAVFADFDNKVWVIEIDKEKLRRLKEGKVPFYEPGLEKLILKNQKNGRLKFSESYHEAIPNSEIIFICVGTPNRDGEINLSFILSATKSIAENLKKPVIVAIKSTVPPGVNGKLKEWMRKYTRVKFDLASVPEFLREGKALEDTLHPYRVVIGAERKDVSDKLSKLYQKISGERLICDSASAQMIKYASNAFLPTKISFANSIAVLCDKLGANVDKVAEGMGMDKRIGLEFLKSGVGFGGSCFSKDIKALIQLAKNVDYDFKILKAVQDTNDVQIDYFIEKTMRLCGGSIEGKTLVVLGLAFKPETSDMREACSIYVIEGLKKLGAKVRACDPVAISEAKRIISGVQFITDSYEALKGADALLLVTEWREYQNLDFKKVKKLMRSPVIVDGRNIYNRKYLEKLGFIYEGVGR